MLTFNEDACACPKCGCREGNASNGRWTCAHCGDGVGHHEALMRNQASLLKALGVEDSLLHGSAEFSSSVPLMEKDYKEIRSLLNGWTMILHPGRTPVASRLDQFFVENPEAFAMWNEWKKDKSDL